MMNVERQIADEVRQEIHRRLDHIEAENDVRILFCCESGSRAWGFSSEDSDYDVRFLYLSRPEWYLSVDLEEKRDVIETPIEGVWDINGWDLRKALRLYRKSNPPLLEWLQSPIVYRQQSEAAARMRDLLSTFYDPKACMYHYLHMAQGNFRGYLKAEQVKTKKYFYVLRPLLGCRWIERNLGAVPMEFEQLVNATDLPRAVIHEIETLIEIKRHAGELGLGPQNQVLNEFITSEFDRHADNSLQRVKPQTDLTALNDIFQSALAEVWR